jgi:hypothetical protein
MFGGVVCVKQSTENQDPARSLCERSDAASCDGAEMYRRQTANRSSCAKKSVPESAKLSKVRRRKEEDVCTSTVKQCGDQIAIDDSTRKTLDSSESGASVCFHELAVVE